jgi:hypothetical protein
VGRKIRLRLCEVDGEWEDCLFFVRAGFGRGWKRGEEREVGGSSELEVYND